MVKQAAKHMPPGKLTTEHPAKTEDAKAKQQRLALGFRFGMRFNSFKVLNQACARPWYL
ncbi:hypothetical protein QBC47DRAFT_407736 [Echria macrotheca]|uniref:Uncharacterized protein n=1 Tax=Echria macrotheca TaxID=438768 RepID=A0AAJ0B0X4_9PEZI|nr:hypothetical protein QBC47DRAFT_407736 [Echria macrotheca]